MRRREFDSASLVAGVVLIAFGTLVLLDHLDALHLSFGYLWPTVLAAVGAVLLAVGLARR